MRGAGGGGHADGRRVVAQRGERAVEVERDQDGFARPVPGREPGQGEAERRHQCSPSSGAGPSAAVNEST